MEKQSENSSQLAKIDSLNSIDGILAFGEVLVKSGLVPYNNSSDCMSCILLGRELGIGALTAVNHIYNVNGKASPDVHVISALLLKGGVIYKILKNYEPIPVYLGIGKTFKTEDVEEYPHLYQRITAKTPKEEYDKTKEQCIKTYETYKVGNDSFNNLQTVIYFERKVRQLDGTFKEMSHTQTFKWSDAVAQGWTTKQNWEKMPAVMMLSRCLTMGGRFIADDLMLGCLEVSEASDVYNKPYTITLDGNAKPAINVVKDDVTKTSPVKDGSSETTAQVNTTEVIDEATFVESIVTAHTEQSS